jgi:hypothetical protein
MPAIIVASTVSRIGGRAECRRHIQAGEPVHKINDDRRGGSTRHGNGPGVWVCSACAAHADVNP